MTAVLFQCKLKCYHSAVVMRLVITLDFAVTSTCACCDNACHLLLLLVATKCSNTCDCNGSHWSVIA